VCIVQVEISAYPEMAEKKEQHVCIKFCFNLEENATEAFETLKVCFGEQKMEEHKFFSRFISSKIVLPLPEMLNTLGFQQWAKQMKIWMR
jgi:hypothetical protein